ncbi:MAG: OmpA family protein [bacterium]
MKKYLLAVGAALILAQGAIAAEGPYVGATLSGIALDSDRFVSGDEDSMIAGGTLGYGISNNLAVEANIGTDVSEQDMDAYQLNLVYYFGEDDHEWRPFLLGGLSRFDLDHDELTLADDDDTEQAQLGVGLATMLTDNWEFRGDFRLYQNIGSGDSTTDGALTFAFNYFFNASAAPAPAPEPAAVIEEAAPETRTITIRLNVEFDFDRATVRAIYGDELLAVANAMKEHSDIELVLEGHTDWVGTDNYNQGLSERRAAAVKAKLVEDYGIPGNRISTVGYGESRPVATNETDEGRQRNRRVIGEMTYTEVVE